MKHGIFGILSAVAAAGCLMASEPAPDQIKLQNQYVEYRLTQGEIYRIYVKMDDGVTTVQFPSAITEIAGKNVSSDGKGTDFIIQAQPGSYYFNIAATVPGATGTLTVTHNRKLYILYLIQSEKEAYASVVFGQNSGKRNFTDNVVTTTPKVTPARLVSLIDIAKKFDALSETHPDTVAGCERVRFKNRYRCGKYDIHLLDATRFEDEDTIIFHVVLENLTNEEIPYDKHSFSAHAGNSIHYMSVSDASGLMLPKSKTHAWFGITSTPEGGRNNLKADNDWLLALTTREMHTENLQSLRNESRIKAEKQAEARKKLLEDEKLARMQIHAAESIMKELKKEKSELDKAKSELKAGQEKLEKEKSDLREESRTLKAAKEIQKMCNDTQAAVKNMREQARKAVDEMKKKPEKSNERK